MKINIGDDMFFGASPEIFRRAEELRKQMTPAEQTLWEELKAKKVNGMKFRRQHPLNNFIADFYCHKQSLLLKLMEGFMRRRTRKNMTSVEQMNFSDSTSQ